jgi:hypothetical protein
VPAGLGARDEARLPDDDDEDDADARAVRPTVEDMGVWSFPASDPPATWNWEPRAS